jgi:hypothetical protein
MEVTILKVLVDQALAAQPEGRAIHFLCDWGSHRKGLKTLPYKFASLLPWGEGLGVEANPVLAAQPREHLKEFPYEVVPYINLLCSPSPTRGLAYADIYA